MKKLFLALPLLAGVSWAGTTYYSGTQTQASYNRLLDQVNSITEDVIVLKSTDYTPGIMESTAVTEVRSSEASGNNLHFSLKHQINHSLVSVAPENSRFGAASIVTTLLIDENYSDDNKAFLKSFESGEPFVATTEVAVDGATTSEITINAVDHSEGSKHLKSRGAVIQLATTANGNVTGDATTEYFMFSDDNDERGEVSDFSVKFSMERSDGEDETSPYFHDLNTEATLGEFNFSESPDKKVSLSDLSAKINTEKLGDETKLSPLFYLLHIKELKPEKIDFDKLNYEAKIGDVEIVEGTDKHGNVSDMNMKININKLENENETSPIFYDVNIESSTADFNFTESNNKIAGITDMSAKLNLNSFGNGKKLLETLHTLESAEPNLENLHFDDLNLEANLGKMNFEEIADEKVDMSDMTVKFSMNRLGDVEVASPFFFDMNIDAKLGEISVIENGMQRASIEGAHYELVQDISSDEPSTHFSMGVDSMEVEAVPLQSFDADVALTGFSTTEMLANESLFEQFSTSKNPRDILRSEKAIEVMRATLKPDTTMNIKLDAKSSEGDGNADMDLKFTGNGSDDGYTGMVTVGDLAKSFAATAAADIDKAAIMQTPLGGMLEHPMAQAYLTVTEDKVALNAVLDKLVLTVNEQVIPLDLMAGERLNLPLESLLENF